jgi:hypothetical protein
MAKTTNTDRFESGFVRRLIASLGSGVDRWERKSHVTEFDFAVGRTDVIVLSECGQILAFEAKLTRWRDALYQAHRNRSFAHASFVAVPPATAARASLHHAAFTKHGVGLCTIDSGVIRILIPAKVETPILQWLCDKALTRLVAKHDRAGAAKRGRSRMCGVRR